jgi:hypothetical protein
MTRIADVPRLERERRLLEIMAPHDNLYHYHQLEIDLTRLITVEELHSHSKGLVLIGSSTSELSIIM